MTMTERVPLALIPFDLTTIADVDGGRIAAAFLEEMRGVVKDCMNRPGDNRPRKIQLEILLTPLIADDGSCESINGEFVLQHKAPSRRSKPVNFLSTTQGHLKFNPDSAGNAGQRTIFDDGNGDE